MFEEVKIIIAEKKNSALKEFEEEIAKSVNVIAILTQNQKEKIKKIQREETKNLIFIRDYPWF